MKRRRIVVHPSGPGLIDTHGIGAPRVAPPMQQRPGTFDPTKTISDALGTAFQRAVNDLLSPGEVLLGAVLIVVGLLIATGQMGKVGKAGVFVASRGAIK